MRVAVVGSTGTIGRPLVDVLARDHEVVGIARRPPETGPARVEWLAADATDAAAMRRALDGVAVVYHLVHSLGSSSFEELDRAAAAAVADAAAAAGARQIVYLGGLGEGSADLSPHLRSRAETAQILAGGDVPVTTLRAAMIVGAGSAAFETIVALVERLPVMVCPRWVSVETQPVALADVLDALVGVCGNDGHVRPDVRPRRPGGDDLSHDDGARGQDPGQAPDPDRGPVPDTAALVAVAAPRHTRERGRGAPARGGTPHPDGRP